MPEDVAAYDALLAQVVKAPRLSGSKVKSLTELALALVQHDTHIVTALYKQFKARPGKSTARISALYVFDAIARAARTGAKANGAQKGPGTPAGLLAKMEGVIDGIVDGMVEDGWKEGRDKLRKVSDIWQKANTFPPPVIKRIAAKLATVASEPEDLDDGPSYASQVATTPSSTTPTATPPPAPSGTPTALPASIMALLGIQPAPTPSASHSPAPTLDIAALLANVSNVVPAPAPAPALNQAQLAMLASFSQPPAQAGPSNHSRSRSPPPRERSNSPPPRRDPRARARSRSPPRAVDPRARQMKELDEDAGSEMEMANSDDEQPSRSRQAQPPVQPPVATLQTFDMSTFDGTKPEAWVALAKAWTNTTGAEPNQWQLMYYIQTGQVMPLPNQSMAPGRF